MHIDHIKTMKRVGRVLKHATHPKKLVFQYDQDMTRALRTDERGRVYALCVDGEIKKIGGSQAKNGIAGTYGSYFGGFSKGNSERTYCVWNYMRQAVDAGKVVEVYCVWADVVQVDVPTMTGLVKQVIAVDYHAIENNFVSEYVKLQGHYPELNIQESGKKWIDTGLMEGYINKDGSIFDPAKSL